MPRLSTLKPRVQAAPARLQQVASFRTERDRSRSAQKRRAEWLTEHPCCIDCEAAGLVVAADEVDHEVPLWKGGADDESNFASRCKPHHAKKTAREAAERAGCVPSWT